MKISKHKCLVIYISLLFLASCLFVAWHFFRLLNIPILAQNASPVIIVLDKSATASQFVNTLKNKKLIKSSKLLLFIIRMEHASQRLKAGIYQINPGETAIQLVNRVVAGDVMTFNFTIIEGSNQKKISQDLMHAPYLEYQPDTWGLITQKHTNAEGLLLADTYQYSGGVNAQVLLEKANHNLMNYLNDSWAHRAPNLPYKTPYELLIAASIIEKETAIPQERKLISGVMINRIKKYMPLQMDPTVIYGLGDAYKGTLSHQGVATNTNCYGWKRSH